MGRWIDLQEFEKLTGNTPAQAKKMIRDGKLEGENPGGGKWYVFYESNDDVIELKNIIYQLVDRVEMLSKHLGVKS